jgi:hypothetical protein
MINLFVCDGRIEEVYKLFWRVASVHVACEETAVFSADNTSQSLQLSLIKVRDCASTFQELYRGNVRARP